MADDFESGIEHSYRDLDPHLADQRERDRQKVKRKSATQLANETRDANELLNDDRFIRWLLTQFERAGILDPSFHDHEGSTQYLCGFRSFALAMFGDLEKLDPSLMVRMMLARSKNLEKKDTQNDQVKPPADD